MSDPLTKDLSVEDILCPHGWRRPEHGGEACAECLDSPSSNPGLWDSLRALRDGKFDTVTLKRQQAEEILRTNELLQKMVCDCSNKLMRDRAAVETTPPQPFGWTDEIEPK